MWSTSILCNVHTYYVRAYVCQIGLVVCIDKYVCLGFIVNLSIFLKKIRSLSHWVAPLYTNQHITYMCTIQLSVITHRSGSDFSFLVPFSFFPAGKHWISVFLQ